MPKFIIGHDVGFGRFQSVIFADSIEEAYELAHENMKDQSEDSHWAMPFTEESLKEAGGWGEVEDETGSSDG